MKVYPLAGFLDVYMYWKYYPTSDVYGMQRLREGGERGGEGGVGENANYKFPHLI